MWDLKQCWNSNYVLTECVLIIYLARSISSSWLDIS